jgi:DNA processing protein
LSDVPLAGPAAAGPSLSDPAPPSEAWLALLGAAAPGTRYWPALLRAAGSAEALIAMSDAALDAHRIDESARARLRRPDPAFTDRCRQWLARPRRALITLGSPAYPPKLAETPDAPLALWARGVGLDLLAAAQLAIVGSRNPTRSAETTAEGLARYLSGCGLTITSGLAVGIDAAGHRGALSGCGATVAVLGTGPDIVFPRRNKHLAQEIAARGVLLSEYPPGVPSRRHHFPQRNRIIAGLALGTLVVEAGRHSGSLITARFATDYGREVFAMPGSIHNPLARGCHWLIKQGAKLVEEGADVLVELAPLLGLDTIPEPRRAEEGPPASSIAADPAYRGLLDKLEFEPTGINELVEITGLTAAELSSMLLLLEMEGFVEALPGGRYSRMGNRNR